MKTKKISRVSTIIVLLLVFSGYPDQSLGRGEVDGKRSKKNLSISLIGFYNNEAKNAFLPRRIGYGAIVDTKIVHERIAAKIDTTKFDILPHNALESTFDTFFSEENKKKLGTLIKDMLVVLDETLQNGKSPLGEVAKLSFPSMVYYKNNQFSISENDVILVVVGLESRIRGKNWLRSAMVCVSFTGEGEYRGWTYPVYWTT